MAGSGLDADDVVSVSLVDVDGNSVRTAVVNSLNGWITYPGASVSPVDWPGWALNGSGEWIEDPTDRRLANGGEFIVSVNGVTVDSVAFPAAPTDCDGPPIEPTVKLSPACIDGIPHISYELSQIGPNTSATFIATNLDDAALGQTTVDTLAGTIPYPGASLDPRDWPGWRWDATAGWLADPTDARSADGGEIRVEVNGAEIDTVAFGAEPTACGSPPDQLVALTLVVDSVGGDLSADDVTMSATGTLEGNELAGPGPQVSGGDLQPDVFTLDEVLPSGFTAGSWTCSAGELDGNRLTLLSGTAACTLDWTTADSEPDVTTTPFTPTTTPTTPATTTPSSDPQEADPDGDDGDSDGSDRDDSDGTDRDGSDSSDSDGTDDTGLTSAPDTSTTSTTTTTEPPDGERLVRDVIFAVVGDSVSEAVCDAEFDYEVSLFNLGAEPVDISLGVAPGHLERADDDRLVMSLRLPNQLRDLEPETPRTLRLEPGESTEEPITFRVAVDPAVDDQQTVVARLFVESVPDGLLQRIAGDLDEPTVLQPCDTTE